MSDTTATPSASEYLASALRATLAALRPHQPHAQQPEGAGEGEVEGGPVEAALAPTGRGEPLPEHPQRQEVITHHP